MTETLRPDEVTYAFGPEPMLLEDRGLVDHIGANGKSVRYRVAVLKPMPVGGD